eukprot:FR735236.1.p1 GENE.FR735236.1~~FR735236.1.p1  ORF type:complete len:142 (+),score=14.21 FR735236.1:494-919(+)
MVLGILGIGIVLTNAVLHFWSALTRSRGSHDGMNRMVDQASPSLSFANHLYMMVLAVSNAWCEEAVSRGLFMYQLERHGLPPPAANVIPAAGFGFPHYYGNPLGWTGVALTSVYGLIRGKLLHLSRGAAACPDRPFLQQIN